MKKDEQTRTKIEDLTALLVFGIFAVCILWVLLTGGRLYRTLTVRDRFAYEKRTAVQYLTTKVRQADGAGRIAAGKMGGSSALVIAEEIEGEIYCTWIYCYDGYLRELFASADSNMESEDGEKILKAETLSVEYDKNEIRAKLKFSDGIVQEILLCPRSGRVVAQ